MRPFLASLVIAMFLLTAEVIIVRKEVYPDPPSIPEGRWDVYLVSLPNRPYFPVTINFVTLTPTITSSPPSLTFDPEVWNVPQELTVIALEDSVNRDDVYGSGFKLALDSEDMNYNERDLPDFEVSVEDNDEGIAFGMNNFQAPGVSNQGIMYLAFYLPKL